MKKLDRVPKNHIIILTCFTDNKWKSLTNNQILGYTKMNETSLFLALTEMERSGLVEINRQDRIRGRPKLITVTERGKRLFSVL